MEDHADQQDSNLQSLDLVQHFRSDLHRVVPKDLLQLLQAGGDLLSHHVEFLLIVLLPRLRKDVIYFGSKLVGQVFVGSQPVHKVSIFPEDRERQVVAQ